MFRQIPVGALTRQHQRVALAQNVVVDERVLDSLRHALLGVRDQQSRRQVIVARLLFQLLLHLLVVDQHQPPHRPLQFQTVCETHRLLVEELHVLLLQEASPADVALQQTGPHVHSHDLQFVPAHLLLEAHDRVPERGMRYDHVDQEELRDPVRPLQRQSRLSHSLRKDAHGDQPLRERGRVDEVLEDAAVAADDDVLVGVAAVDDGWNVESAQARLVADEGVVPRENVCIGGRRDLYLARGERGSGRAWRRSRGWSPS